MIISLVNLLQLGRKSEQIIPFQEKHVCIKFYLNYVAISARPGWTFASRPGPGRDDLDPGRDRDRDRDDFKNPAGTGIRVIPAGIPGF